MHAELRIKKTSRVLGACSRMGHDGTLSACDEPPQKLETTGLKCESPLDVEPLASLTGVCTPASSQRRMDQDQKASSTQATMVNLLHPSATTTHQAERVASLVAIRLIMPTIENMASYQSWQLRQQPVTITCWRMHGGHRCKSHLFLLGTS